MDKEYLNMVIALPDDFFENITPEFGNLFWVETDQGWKEDYSRKTYAILDHVFDDGNYSLILMDSSQIDERLYKWDFQYNKRDEVTYWKGWLIPSQEQLIKMIKDNQILKNVKLSDLEILERVVEWHMRRDPEKVQEKCAECLFLDVLMWLNGNIWDGEKWI